MKMDTRKIDSFQNVLSTIMSRSERAWVYLPSDGKWSLDSEAATLESNEVPPELEDEPDAGVPLLAKQHGLIQVIPVATLQDVVLNALRQKSHASSEDLFAAFNFYYERDAFIEM